MKKAPPLPPLLAGHPGKAREIARIDPYPEKKGKVAPLVRELADQSKPVADDRLTVEIVSGPIIKKRGADAPRCAVCAGL